ncbi:hypothetical protein MMC29_003923 [Sticta canariensis]|nr:hypothetical protein [Sticta canariensis]
MAEVSEHQRRPRARSVMSFTSNKNRKSIGSFSKASLTETSKEKAAHRVTSKADPTKAINEAQPATAVEQVTLESIRAIQHRDANGDIITDPDRSNPTRPRFERPLDTIRSFEAAINGAYDKRPYSRAATEPENLPPQNRRHSYYQGYNPRQRAPGENGGYYGNRVSSRPDSYIDNYATPPNQYNSGRKLGQRMNSNPTLYGHNGQTTYPSPTYPQSYDTGGSISANDSHGTDQWGNSTDPSSENSSIDRVQPAPKPDLGEVYGFNGFGGAPQFQGPILEEHGKGAPAYGQPGYGQSQMMSGAGQPYQGNGALTGSPSRGANGYVPKVPIKLGNSSTANLSPNASGEKKKGWLKRRFSKS